MCAPKMAMVDVLCPDCHVPTFTLDFSKWLACGLCGTVWRLFRTPEELQAAFEAAMEEAPRRSQRARPAKGFL